MSVIFEDAEGHELWNPSNNVANLALGSVRLVEQFLESQSGLSSIQADTVFVDLEKLDSFVEIAATRLAKNRHPAIANLCAGGVSIAAGLLGRGRKSISHSLPGEVVWVAEKIFGRPGSARSGTT